MLMLFWLFPSASIDADNVDLGTACGRLYTVGSLCITDPGDSDILKTQVRLSNHRALLLWWVLSTETSVVLSACVHRWSNKNMQQCSATFAAAVADVPLPTRLSSGDGKWSMDYLHLIACE